MSDVRQLKIVIFTYILKYISYLFLTYVVLFSVASLLFPLLAFKIDFSLSFLKYLAFINPKFGEGDFSGGNSEIMQIFGFVSFIVWGFTFLIKKIIEKIIKKELVITLRNKIMYGIIFLTVLSLIDVIASIYIKEIFGVLFFILLYFISLVCLVVYLGINHFANKIANSNIY